MKLSFYTGGWPNISWNDACILAADMELQGVELLYSKVEATPLLEGANAGSLSAHSTKPIWSVPASR